MIFAEGGLAVVALFLWVFCIFDVIAAEATLIRNLPKITWLFIVILIPDVGSVAWLVLGRPLHAGFTPGSTERRSSSYGAPRMPSRTSDPQRAPDDSPEFLATMEERARLARWEEELRRREEDLKRRDEGDA